MANAAEISANLAALLAGAAKALTLEVASNLIADCPVDTGHARRNFVPSVGEAFSDEDDGAAQTAGQIAVISYQIGDGDLFVTNNVPYMDQLVLGSSQQQPAGWDLVAVDRAVDAIEAKFGARIDVTSSADVSSRNASAAAGVAAAFSPFGGEE